MEIKTEDINMVMFALMRVTEGFNEIRQHILRAEQLITQLYMEKYKEGEYNNNKEEDLISSKEGKK